MAYYRIVARIMYKGKIIGYVLQDRLGNLCEATKDDVYRLVKNNNIENVKYSRSKNSLSGVGIDLRKLPIVKFNKNKFEADTTSRHESAREYLHKLRLLDSSIQFDITYLENDRVRLDRIFSNKHIKKFKIPSFITDFRIPDSKATSIFRIDAEYIIIDNPEDIYIDASFIFSFSDLENVKIQFKRPDKLKGLRGLFMMSNNLESVELLDFGTIKVTDISNMFMGCTNLKKVNFGNLDISNVSEMEGIFRRCYSLVNIDIPQMSTDKSVNIQNMFTGCCNLKTIKFNNKQKVKVKDITGLFANCTDLLSVDLKSFDTSECTSFSSMFSGCKSIRNLDLSSLDSSKITSMNDMFSGCISLESLDLSSFKTKELVSMRLTFSSCNNLKQLNLSGFDTSKVEDMQYTFANCKSLEHLDLSGFKTNSLDLLVGMFYYSGIKELDLSKFLIRDGASTSNMFLGCSSLEKLDINRLKGNNHTNLGLYTCKKLSLLDISKLGFSERNTIKSIIKNISPDVKILVNKNLEKFIKELLGEHSVYNIELV